MPTHNVEGPPKYVTEGTNQKLRPNAMTGERVPTVDTLRNFFLMPTTEMLMLFQTVREVVL